LKHLRASGDPYSDRLAVRWKCYDLGDDEPEHTILDGFFWSAQGSGDR
jgi:hypothetical protein